MNANTAEIPPRTRYAPTPSGWLHIGNAYNFVLTWLAARSRGGSITLRIDDIDAERSRPEYVEDVFRTLDWLGLDYDEGPSGPDEFYALYSQLLHPERYQTVLDEWKARGLLFACTCSRRMTGGSGCTGLCRQADLDFEAPETAWRFRLESNEYEYIKDCKKGEYKVNLGTIMPHFVVRTKQGRAAYQVVSLVEDVRQGMTLLVRGADLTASSAAQTYLARRWSGGAHFVQNLCFWHHELLLDEQGNKLSKSKGSASLHYRRQSGQSPQALYLEFARRLGLPPCSTAAELLGRSLEL